MWPDTTIINARIGIADGGFNPDLRVTLTRLGVNRFDQGHQLRPGRHLLHLSQKQLPAGGFVKLFKRAFGERAGLEFLDRSISNNVIGTIAV